MLFYFDILITNCMDSCPETIIENQQCNQKVYKVSECEMKNADESL